MRRLTNMLLVAMVVGVGCATPRVERGGYYRAGMTVELALGAIDRCTEELVTACNEGDCAKEEDLATWFDREMRSCMARDGWRATNFNLAAWETCERTWDSRTEALVGLWSAAQRQAAGTPQEAEIASASRVRVALDQARTEWVGWYELGELPPGCRKP